MACIRARSWTQLTSGADRIDRSLPSNSSEIFAKSASKQFRYGAENGVGFESGGWDSTRELMLVTGYGSSEGEYWRLELKSDGEGKWNGTHYTALPDGSDVTARFRISTIDKNNAEWTSEGMTSNGESVKMHGRFKRTTE